MNDQSVRIEDLKEDQKELAELIGLNAYLKIVGAYGGSWIYIPMAKSVMRPQRNEQICKEFDGGNYRELAQRYNLSESMIRIITEDKLQTMKKDPIPGQVSMFESQSEHLKY